jgi:hypothetical protein
MSLVVMQISTDDHQENLALNDDPRSSNHRPLLLTPRQPQSVHIHEHCRQRYDS